MSQSKLYPKSDEHGNSNSNDSISIDTLIAELDEIVRQLEDENTSIENAFELFEKGADIASSLNKKIDSYEKRLKILSANLEMKEIKSEDLE